MSCKKGCDIIFFKSMDFIFKDSKFCIALIFSKRTDNDLAMLGERKSELYVICFARMNFSEQYHI